jgi:hypothetical protein
MNACAKASLYCWEMNVFLYKIKGDEKLEIRCTRGIRLVFMICFCYWIGILSAFKTFIDLIKALALNSSRISLA